MSSERLLRALADVVQEDDDPRWARLAQGTIGPAEEQELRQLSEEDADAARRFAAYAPINRATKDRIAGAIAGLIETEKLAALRSIRPRKVAVAGGVDASELDANTAIGSGRSRSEQNLFVHRYRHLQALGTGGMGSVYLARAMDRSGQPVALKILRAQFTERERRALLREAQTLARLTSGHAVRMLEFGVLEGAAYIAMEFLSGLNLAHWLATRGALPVETAVDFILQACDAVAEAHELGIVHRDIKPSNLFAVLHEAVVERVKVLDFGISGHEPAVVGTLAYMAPEQLRGAEPDRRADIWSLGVTLYQLLTRRLPFEEPSPTRLIRAVRSGVEPTLELSGGIADVVRKCLRPNGADRYDSVQEFAEALVPFGSERASAYCAQIAKRRR